MHTHAHNHTMYDINSSAEFQQEQEHPLSVLNKESEKLRSSLGHLPSQQNQPEQDG